MAQTARTAPPPSNRKPSATRPSTPARISLPNLIDEHGAVKMEALAAAFSMSRAQLRRNRRPRPRRIPEIQPPRRPQGPGQGARDAGNHPPGPKLGRQRPPGHGLDRAEPIPAFGGRTAEALVKSGHAAAVRDYIDHLATGGYA